MNTTEYPPRHLPPFRPLVPGDPPWHRTDFTPDMLEDKDGKGPLRPLLLGEKTEAIDELPLNAPRTGDWRTLNTSYGPALERDVRLRTRRPLPPPPPTFEHDGKTWNSHVPGDPCPVEGDKQVVMLLSSGVFTAPYRADCQDWSDSGHDQIIGYLIPDAEPQDDTAKLRERIAELEQQLATWETELSAVMPPDFKDWYQNAKSEWPTVACMVIESLRASEAQAWDHLATALTPRPIAEAGPVKEGFVRLFGGKDSCGKWVFYPLYWQSDTHFLDIRLPEPDLHAEYDRAVAEAGGHYEAWLKAKGGVK